MKDQIKTYFNRYVKFSDAEIDEIYSKLAPKLFQKKDYILHEGKICKSKYFIISGLVRSFYIDNKGNEKITQFAIENWWGNKYGKFYKKNALRHIYSST